MEPEQNGHVDFFHTLEALRERHAQDANADWLWNQLVAPGYLTLISGRPKAGKSTLLFGLCAALRTGQPFLGMPTRPTKVLYCCEEKWPTYEKKIGVYGAPDFSYLYYDSPMRLDMLVRRAEEEITAHEIELVILDTWTKWADLPKGINDDKGTREAMGLMEDLAQHVAVIAVGYERKGDGNEFGQGVLGHTEITGRADVIIEIKRKQEGRRLEIIGRTDAPDEIDFAMGDGGVLDVADLDAQLRETVYEAVVSFSLNPMVGPPSKNDIFAAVGGNRGKVLAAVDALQAEGRIRRQGSGNRSGWAPDV